MRKPPERAELAHAPAAAVVLQGQLQVVGTPIGNLGDLSPRALAALREAEVIACEDTRRTGLLLHKLGLPNRAQGGAALVSYHEHNEASRTLQLLQDVRQGRRVVLVSDSGMPGISDPGARLVASARAEGLPATVIPGPCAAVVALVGTGLAGAFTFVGFLPRKPGARNSVWQQALSQPQLHAVVYESPQRVLKTLEELTELAPDRTVWLARELTKLHEEWLHGRPSELLRQLATRAGAMKGECVLVVAGAVD